jgi:hypothetical protein
MAGATTTLDKVIRNFLIERGDMSEHGYKRFLQLAVSGLQEMEYDVSGQPERLDISLDKDRVIPIPPDAVAIIRVAFRYGNSWISSARDNALAINNEYYCGEAGSPNNENVNDLQGVYNDVNILTESYIAKHWRNGQPTGAYFNQSGGNPYTFRINDQLGVIELSSNHPNNVILEYLPTAKEINGEFQIHPFLKEPLIAWLNYSDVRSKRNISKQLINDLERTYIQKKKHAKKRLNAFTKEDFLNAVRSGYSASVKL